MAVNSINSWQEGPARAPTTEELITPFGKFTIEKTREYGFRKLSWDKGILPTEYTSDYTSVQTARFARDKLISELEESSHVSKKALRS